MKTLSLLFTRRGIQWQIHDGTKILEEETHHQSEDTFLNLIEEQLDQVLEKRGIQQIRVYSALNHFTLLPDGFSDHDLAHQLISYNACIDREKEELMLSINKKFQVQFYYLFPKYFYERIKALNLTTRFNFSGEKFLNHIQPKNQKEIHIYLHHHQVEFLAFKDKSLVLYNNLDGDSEVDFLYFILFSLDKINFDRSETHFYIYGETTKNETFISELRKFVAQLHVVFENQPKKNFIFQ